MTDQKQPLTGPEIVELVRASIAAKYGLTLLDETIVAAILATLDAIREPSEAMVRAASEKIFPPYTPIPGVEWRAMIDVLRREIAG